MTARVLTPSPKEQLRVGRGNLLLGGIEQLLRLCGVELLVDNLAVCSGVGGREGVGA